MRLSLLVMSEATPIKSQQHDRPSMKRTRMKPTDMLKWMGEKLMRPQRSTQQMTRDKGRKLGVGEEGFTREEHVSWLSLKIIHPSNFIGTEQVVVSHMHVHNTCKQ